MSDSSDRLDRYSADTMQRFKTTTKVESLGIIKDFLGIYPSVKRPLWAHQVQLIAASVSSNALLIAAGAGSGKTNVALVSWNIQRDANRPVGDLLVLVPNTGVAASWVDEAAGMGIKATILNASGERKLKQLSGGCNVYLLTYSAMQYLLKDSVYKKYRVDDDVADILMAKVGMIVADECHALRSSTSNNFKAACALRMRANFWLSMSATPISDLTHAYTMGKLIDGGAALGIKQNDFLDKWFTLKKTYWGSVEFIPKKLADKEIKDRLDTLQVSFTCDELEQNLPDLVRSVIKLEKTAEMKKIYTEIKKGGIKINGCYHLLNNRTIASIALESGYKTAIDDLSELREVEPIKSSPKLSWLVDFIKSLDETEQVVIFTEFIATDTIIKNALSKAKIKKVKLYREGDKAKNYADFLGGKIKVLVGNSRAIGTGLNLQKAGCRYAVNYEHTFSSTVRIQRDKRLHRGGQQNTVFIYDLTFRDGIDSVIIENTDAGVELTTQMLETKIR